MSYRDANLIAIKEGLYSISKQLMASPKARPTNDIKTLATKLYALLQQGNGPVERFYHIYLICKICGSEKLTKVDKLMKVILPTPPTQYSMSLVSDMMSFALCHPSQYSSVLDYLSIYASEVESTTIDVESWLQAESLALDSPTFCSALLCRSDLMEMGVDKKILSKWLQDLSKTEQDFQPVNITYIIRHTLTSNKAIDESNLTEHFDSDLHFGILTLIQSKRCQNLTSQFLIDITNNIHQISSDDPKTRQFYEQTVDRFAQILSVAAASKVATITSSLKTALNRLSSNQIIAAVIRWQNK